MKKKLLAILLCFAMIAGMLSVTVFAAGVYEIRYKGTKNYEAGAVAVITVPKGDAPTYRVVEGANGSWTENSDGSLAFRADGAVSKFAGIKVDGVTVASDRYTVGTDTAVITLKNEYLAGLSVGTHTLTVVYRDGECSADFEVLAAPHTHDYGDEWKYDETEHWHECTCGDKADKAAHSFDWKVDKAATKAIPATPEIIPEIIPEAATAHGIIPAIQEIPKIPAAARLRPGIAAMRCL